MEALLGNSLAVFLGLTLILMGFAAYMTGYALANVWKPWWHALGYALLLGVADRFLAYALFDGELTSPGGYLIDSAALAVVALLAHRVAQARQMVRQYPWLYRPRGPFGWCERGPTDAPVEAPGKDVSRQTRAC